MWVWDEVGNGDFCKVGILLSDNGNVCPEEGEGGEENGQGGASVSIAGEVRTYYNMMIDDVNVSAETASLSEYPKSDMTNNNGQYAFTNTPIGFNYNLSAQKEDDYLSGVSTLDLVFMQRHILGLQDFENPYQIIATDATADGTVSAVDLAQLRQLILGNIETLANVTPWLFLDASGVFFDKQNPWPFTEGIDISNLAIDQMNEDFIGVKIGDVNQSYQGAESRSNGVLSLVAPEMNLVPGQVAHIQITAQNFVDVTGYQFSLNHAGLAFMKVESGKVSITNENIGSREDMLTMSWNDAKALSLDSEDVLFTLVFEAQSNINLSQTLTLNSVVTKAEAYVGKDYDIYGVELEFDHNNDVFALYQNQPNPFVSTTIIGFNLPSAGQAKLSIFKVDGSEVKVIKGNYPKGYNEIVIDQRDLLSSGILYYQLNSGEMNQIRKMILLD